MTITEFLLARIAEDEATAQLEIEDGYGSYIDSGWPATRVLAECEAKRAIVELWSDNDGDDMTRNAYGDHAMLELGGEKAMHWGVLRILAAMYADHPDYEEAWRP